MSSSLRTYLATSWNRDNEPHETRSSPFIVALTIVLLLALSIFFGMFVGLNLPQVVINKYYSPTQCTITNASILFRYCPSVSCSTCSNAPTSPSCSSVQELQQSLSPEPCAQGTGACAEQVTCNERYKCCSQLCLTCESYSTSCTGSSKTRASYSRFLSMYMQRELSISKYTASKKSFSSNASAWERYVHQDDVTVKCTWKNNTHKKSRQLAASDKLFCTMGCTQSCSNFQCNCCCCDVVNSLSSFFKLNISYTAHIDLHYNKRDGQDVVTTYVNCCNTNLKMAMQLTMEQYLQENMYACYYDTRHAFNIRWSVAYNVGDWVGTCVFAFVVLITTIWMSYYRYAAVTYYLPEWFFKTSFIWLWVGFIIPITSLLPLYVFAAISSVGRVSCLVLLFQFITLGGMPYAFCRWDLVIFAAYTVCIWGAIGWVTPFVGWYVSFIGALFAAWLGAALFAGVVALQVSVRSAQMQANAVASVQPQPIERAAISLPSQHDPAQVI
jgi:hypothetical protein